MTFKKSGGGWKIEIRYYFVAKRYDNRIMGTQENDVQKGGGLAHKHLFAEHNLAENKRTIHQYYPKFEFLTRKELL